LRWLGLLDPRGFVVVAKTVTWQPRRGELRWWCPWRCVRLLRGGGAVNAVSLTNPGLEWWVRRAYPRAQALGYRVAASVLPGNREEASGMAVALRGIRLAYVEVNLSCPNTGSVVFDPHGLRAVRERLGILRGCGHPLVVKLAASQVVPEVVELLDGCVDAYHAINTVPWGEVFSGRTSPLARYPHGKPGGVSGPPIRAHALRAVQTLRGLTAKPSSGGGGITRCGDVAAFAAAGAQAFSIGSSFLWSPWRPNRIVRQYREEFAREEIVRSLNETPRYEPWWDGDYVPGEGCDVP
jgi:dihydroorotate dehydrogenase